MTAQRLLVLLVCTVGSSVGCGVVMGIAVANYTQGRAVPLSTMLVGLSNMCVIGTCSALLWHQRAAFMAARQH